MASKYRILISRFWLDPKTHDLNDKQRLFMIYAITGIEACAHNNSGIYEINRAAFQNYCGWTLNEIDDVIDHFNNKKRVLLEYDTANHIISVKSFYKHNGKKNGLAGIMDDFEETFDKAPHFWAEFGEKYRKKLLSAVEKMQKDKNLSEEQKDEQFKFYERLINLKDEINNPPSFSPENFKAIKLGSNSRGIII
jgi:hypothetical protein